MLPLRAFGAASRLGSRMPAADLLQTVYAHFRMIARTADVSAEMDATMKAGFRMSDSSMNRPSGAVFGTAGHIDHGKTSLVRALTGMDTDRLAEEKRRGISIDLGFAHLDLPNGRRIGLIDVPGHERFIKNMLAGAAGIEAVVLVVSAPESVKPQTREHFEICRLLGISRGVIVLTKADIANSEQLRTAQMAVRSLCAGSFLENAQIIAVSAVTGAGITELKNELAALSERSSPRGNGGFARLPIDRSFAMKGFGTVVTGTLWNATLRKGETVQIHPLQREARIRDLQVHGRPVITAVAGHRTAVNLAGIESAEIRRGHVLSQPAGLETTLLIDASVEWLGRIEFSRAHAQMAFHIGTTETMAKVKILGSESKTQTLARLYVSEPVLAVPGDRFVLRCASPARTVAGGVIIDAFPPLRLNRAKTLERLRRLERADLRTRVRILIEESVNGRRTSELVRATGATEPELRNLISNTPDLVFAAAAQRVVTTTWLDRARRKIVDWLGAFHAKHPSAAGAPLSAARLGLEPQLASLVFEGFESVRVRGELVSLATHTARFSSNESEGLRKIEGAFRQGGLEPPGAVDVLRSVSQDPNEARRLLETLVKNKSLVRVTGDLIFHADAIAHIRKSLSAHKGRKFSVPEFKEWTRLSRKYAIPLLEFLDRERVTRREGDARVVL